MNSNLKRNQELKLTIRQALLGRISILVTVDNERQLIVTIASLQVKSKTEAVVDQTRRIWMLGCLLCATSCSLCNCLALRGWILICLLGLRRWHAFIGIVLWAEAPVCDRIQSRTLFVGATLGGIFNIFSLLGFGIFVFLFLWAERQAFPWNRPWNKLNYN